MKTFIVLALALTVVQALNIDQEWENFKAKYKRNYISAFEDNQRREVFAQNLRSIEKHNAEHALGLHTFTLGVNEFADMSREEFLSKFTAPMKNNFRSKEASYKVVDTSSLPAEVDWRDEGYVTSVKNQRSCGSCWTFSAIGAMEGALMRSTGSLPTLSEQNLLDCVHPKRDGCEGGWMNEAFQYAIDKGIMSEADYPYKAKDSGFDVCYFEADKIVAQMTKFTKVRFCSESALQEAVANVGPVSVAIDASNLQFYKKGVYKDSTCSSTMLNHGVLAVGYGVSKGKDYWQVKNSWGTSWGMDGYVKMARNNRNMCGIARAASYPTA